MLVFLEDRAGSKQKQVTDLLLDKANISRFAPGVIFNLNPWGAQKKASINCWPPE